MQLYVDTTASDNSFITPSAPFITPSVSLDNLLDNPSVSLDTPLDNPLDTPSVSLDTPSVSFITPLDSFDTPSVSFITPLVSFITPLEVSLDTPCSSFDTSFITPLASWMVWGTGNINSTSSTSTLLRSKISPPTVFAKAE